MDEGKQWIDREILTHTDLNIKFNSIINDEDLADAVTKKHAATLIGTKTIDETDIANTKVIAYNSTSGNLEYESAGTADAHAATHVTGGGDTIANVVAAGNAGLMTGADKTKLNGIEALADVTDATSVNAAGAVMTTDTVNVLSDITSTGANIEDAVTKKHAATLIGTKTIDETDIANTKVIAYNSTSGNLEYESAGTADAHAATHVTGGGDTIANVVAAGNAGLMTGADKTKLNGIEATYAVLGTNADITSMTALTQITRATGGAFDIAIGGAAGDDFTIDTDKFIIEGDTGNTGIGITPETLLHINSITATTSQLKVTNNNSGGIAFLNVTPDSEHLSFDVVRESGSWLAKDTSYAIVAKYQDMLRFRGDTEQTVGNPINPSSPVDLMTLDLANGNVKIVNGQLDMNTHKIVGVVDPTTDQGVATKKFVIDNSGSLTWSVISTNTNAVTRHGYFINASGGNVTLTLPASPSIGNTIAVCDSYNKATTNTITIARNTKNIEGAAENLVININGAGFTMVYSNTTRGWEIVTEI